MLKFAQPMYIPTDVNAPACDNHFKCKFTVGHTNKNPNLEQLQDNPIFTTHEAKHKPPVLSNNYYKIVRNTSSPALTHA